MRKARGSSTKMEPLEDRRMLAGHGLSAHPQVPVGTLAADGTFTVTATEGNDTISLSPGGISVVVQNGSMTTFVFGELPAPVTKVVIKTLGGDDVVGVSDSANVEVDLGAGSKNVSLDESGPVTVNGGRGNDTVVEREDDVLASFGGPGVNTLDVTYSYYDGPIDLTQFPTVKNLLGAHGDVEGNALDNYITLTAPNFPYAGQYHYITGGAGNDTVVAGGGEIPIAFDGGRGDDTFVADGLADTFIGGAGSDTVDFSGLAYDLVVDLNAGTATTPAFDGSDSLSGVENVVGGSGNDTLIGDDKPNILNGGAGNDTITGNGGRDLLIGGTGDDVFYAQDKTRDTILGGAGNDQASVDHSARVKDLYSGIETLLT